MKKKRQHLMVIILILAFASPLFSKETGIASWYISDTDNALTANGEIYDENSSNAAHKSLPFGSLVEVHNLENDKKTIVRINDRGPFVKGRIIDLTPYSAKQLDMYEKGIVQVELREIYIPEIPETQYLRPGDTNWYTIQLGSFKDAERVYDHYMKLWQLDFYPTVEIIEDRLLRLSIRWIQEEKKDDTLEIISELGFKDPLVKAALPPR
ncbi:MAG: septal ring lytic transglycosylase RlpA family protein [Sphaerochaetaceae bacterium]|nr:septal ring lytic transglycosylase RlpA family protein [Sphaerochaetaceae bacterium]